MKEHQPQPARLRAIQTERNRKLFGCKFGIAVAQQSKMNNISNNELADLCASNNLSLGALQEIINTLGPRVSSQNTSCLHQACGNEKATVKIVQLLYNTLPGAFRLRDNGGDLPVDCLCGNGDLDETASLYQSSGLKQL